MICIIADNDLPSRLKVFLSRLNYIKLRLQIANYNIHESVFRLALLAKSFVVLTTVNEPIAAKTNLIRILINPGHFAIKRKQTIVLHSTQSFDLIFCNLRE